MNGGPATAVLDASALLALINHERGRDRVIEAVTAGALVSTVNWSEVLAKLVVSGGDPAEITAMALPAGGAGQLQLVAFDDRQARAAAKIIRKTRSLGLSLADRAALGLALIRGLPVLTTDRAWRTLRSSIKIEIIR